MAEEPTQAQDTAQVPTNAEDAKQAGALSSLDTRGDDDAAAKKEVDTEALGKAMQNLDVKSEEKKKEEAKKAVKVDAKDVALLVEQLELPKAKATDLLKSHDGDALKAMTAWVTAKV